MIINADKKDMSNIKIEKKVLLKANWLYDCQDTQGKVKQQIKICSYIINA